MGGGYGPAVWGPAAAYGYGCVYLDGLAEVTEILPLLPFLLGAKSQSAIQSTTVVCSAWCPCTEILRRGATAEEQKKMEIDSPRRDGIYACVCRPDCSRIARFSFRGRAVARASTTCVPHISPGAVASCALPARSSLSLRRRHTDLGCQRVTPSWLGASPRGP
eukprot:COSAG01_NODE_1511_length_10068_cov_7.643731_10_plen_163_part_00